MHENWRAFLVLSGCTMLLIAAIEAVWRSVGEPRGWAHEIGRKAHHIGIGLIASCLNQYLLSPWSGFVLGLGFGAFLLAGYEFKFVRSLYDGRPREGSAEIRRWRHSWVGPASFSVAVAVLSVLFWHDVPIYRASVL